MTPAAMAFLTGLAVLYAQDLVMGWEYFHKLNIVGAAAFGFFIMFNPG